MRGVPLRIEIGPGEGSGALRARLLNHKETRFLRETWFLVSIISSIRSTASSSESKAT
jgi:hypothetical protein